MERVYLQCPVCGRDIPEVHINQHLDTCVKIQENADEKNAPDQIQKSIKNGGPSMSAKASPSAFERIMETANGRKGIRIEVRRNRDAGDSNNTRKRPRAGSVGAEIITTSNLKKEGLPIAVLENFLPLPTADALLTLMLDECEGRGAQGGAWTPDTYWIADMERTSRRLTCTYGLEGDASAKSSLRRAPSLLLDVAAAVNEAVRQVIQSGDAAEHGGGAWQASYALVNCYRDFGDVVGPHSDHLTKIGKLPTIASLSLGALRRLRLSKKRLGPTTARDAAASGTVVGCDIFQPHNTLVLMLPPCQERWTHEVPREGPGSFVSMTNSRNGISGEARINITFRMDVMGLQVPECSCGERAVMKSRLESDGTCRYYYACNSRSREPCRFYAKA